MSARANVMHSRKMTAEASTPAADTAGAAQRDADESMAGRPCGRCPGLGR